MNKFVVIAHVEGTFSIPFIVTAENAVTAIKKTSMYCCRKGHFATNILTFQVPDFCGVIELE